MLGKIFDNFLTKPKKNFEIIRKKKSILVIALNMTNDREKSFFFSDNFYIKFN